MKKLPKARKSKLKYFKGRFFNRNDLRMLKEKLSLIDKYNIMSTGLLKKLLVLIKSDPQIICVQ